MTRQTHAQPASPGLRREPEVHGPEVRYDDAFERWLEREQQLEEM